MPRINQMTEGEHPWLAVYSWDASFGARSRVAGSRSRTKSLQDYLAHKKLPKLLETPWGHKGIGLM